MSELRADYRGAGLRTLRIITRERYPSLTNAADWRRHSQ
jgi:hypothetical protein